jgi:DNA-binding transcriptional MerR regulator
MNSTAAAAQTELDDERLYRIGDVARMADVKPFVLRYWETEFPMLEPVKSISGHRMYRQQDVDMVMKIKRLLYDEGFTIAGARRHLREQNGTVFVASESHASTHGGQTGHAGHAGASPTIASSASTSASHPENASELLSRKMLLDLRDSLRAFLTLLERR